MNRLRSLELNIHYAGIDAFRNDFLIPSLKCAKTYRRATGYFTVSALIAVSDGLETLARNNGNFDLLIGLHDVDPELALGQIHADLLGDDKEFKGRLLQLLDEVGSLKDALSISRVETIAKAIADGFIRVRVAQPVGVKSQDIFHIKRIIIKDGYRDLIAATGSPNETLHGIAGNYEDLTVFTSWGAAADYCIKLEEDFERIWNGEDESLRVIPLSSEFAESLLAAATEARKNVAIPEGVDNVESENVVTLLDWGRKTVGLHRFSFPGIELLPHQEFAYMKTLSRWPIRALLADEVGLGKTLEMGACLSYLLKTKLVSNVMILAPKNLLYQLQAELNEKFNLHFSVWESSTRSFISTSGDSIKGTGVEPGGLRSPSLTLISSQWARGTLGGGHFFERCHSFPDLLVVDEAHAARKPATDSNSKPTLMYEMLMYASEKIPHILLMSATPMQINLEEYHGLLEILGLPGGWKKFANFQDAILHQATDGQLTLDTARKLSALACEAAKPLNPRYLDRRPTVAMWQSMDTTDLNLVEQSIKFKKDWKDNRPDFVFTNPGQQLTVRSTRASLEKMGYVFPERNFSAPTIEKSLELRQFQMKLDDYLRKAYGSVEQAIESDSNQSLGFVISIYQQRAASTLWSIMLSLERRLEKLKRLSQGDSVQLISESDEDLLDEESDSYPELTFTKQSKNPNQVQVACGREIAYLSDLIEHLRNIKSGPIHGDPKISAALKILSENLHELRTVVFSRYTDSLDALVNAIESDFDLITSVGIGYYSGSECWIRSNSSPKTHVTKSELKRSLDDGEIGVVICSDAASEGLNLQTASRLINLDIPWNPARLEQRIGRIARLGQKSKTVEIVNIWYPDSIEAIMYTRLLERKELYEIAVGSFPRVFSEAIRRQVSHNVSGAIESHSWVLEELEQLRSNLHLQALEELWNATSSEFSISQDFISGIRKIQQIIFDNPMQFGLDSCDEYSHNKGLLGNDIWDRISVKQSESNLHDLYALYNQRGVWAFAMELKGHTYLIPPIFFPDILSSTLGITKLKIRNEWQVSHKPDDSIKLDKLEKIAAESMLPLHEKIFRFGNMTPYPPPPEIPSIDELMRVRVARIELELNI